MAAFLDGRIRWTQIAEVLTEALDAPRRHPRGRSAYRGRRRPPGPRSPPALRHREDRLVTDTIDPPRPDPPATARRRRSPPRPGTTPSRRDRRASDASGSALGWSRCCWSRWSSSPVLRLVGPGRGRRPARVDRPARARPLPHGQAGGMKVTEFFVGFGPEAVSFRRGETEYGVKALPARCLRAHHRHEQPRGGRARRRGPHLPREGLLGPAPGGAGRAGHELRHRASSCWSCSCAGLRPGRQHGLDGRSVGPGHRPRPQPACSQGDRLVSIDGQPVGAFDTAFANAVQSRAGHAVTLVVDRDGKRLTLTPTVGWDLTVGARPSSAR